MDPGKTANTNYRSAEALHSLAMQLRNSLKSWRPKPRAKPNRRRYEHVWLLCWILKDLGWVLLCGFVAWPAALAAIALQAHDVLQLAQAGQHSVSECVHGLAILGWLSGSTVWMTAQLLFEPAVHKSRTSPWYSGSIFAGNEDRFHHGVVLMQAMHVTTLVGLALFYSWSYNGGMVRLSDIAAKIKFWKATSTSGDPTGDILRNRKAGYDDESQSSGPSSSTKPIQITAGPSSSTDSMASTADPREQVLVFGVLTPEVYSKIFIVPWILKDLFWSTHSFVPAVLCIFLVTVLMADYLWLFKKWKNLATLLWTTGSAVWLSHDLVMHDQEIWPLLLSIVLFSVGACVLCGVLITRPSGEDDRETLGCSEERDPLL